MRTLLSIRNLSVEYSGPKHSVLALNSFSCSVFENQCIGILGESGSGKTTLVLAILQLLSASARIRTGSITFEGRELLGLSPRSMEQIRGAGIAFVAQEPSLALNPVLRAIDHVCEVIRAHRSVSREECRREAADLLAELGLASEKHLIPAYPHELSGGQQQRVLLAQALAGRPKLLLADEPTAHLDRSLRLQLYSLLNGYKEKRCFSLLFNTHNRADLYALSDHVLVVYAGQVVEQGTISDLEREPLHPYTRLLIRCMPPYPNRRAKRDFLPTIPELSDKRPVNGCLFSSRCPERRPQCGEVQPPDVQISQHRRVRCHLYGN